MNNIINLNINNKIFNYNNKRFIFILKSIEGYLT